MSTAGWAAVIGTRRPLECADLVLALLEAESRPHAISICLQGDETEYELLKESLTAIGLVRAYPGLTVMRDEGRGASRARNLAIALLGPNIEWIWTPNDTTRPSPRFLAELPAALQAAPDEIGAMAFGYMVDGKVRRAFSGYARLEGWDLWRPLEAAVVWRRAPLEILHGFDERIGTGSSALAQSGEGTDLLCRLADEGWLIQAAPLHVVGRPQHHQLSTSDRLWKEFHYAIGFGYVARKYFSKVRSLASVITPVIRWAQGAEVEGAKSNLALAATTALGRAVGLTLGPVALRIRPVKEWKRGTAP